MTFSFNPNRFKLIEWFSYPCTVCERINEYEENVFHGPRGDKDVKEFFEDCLHEAEHLANRTSLMDNKIAIKVYDMKTNNTFYVGYKDNIWCIGLMLNPYMNSCYTIKFNDEK